MAEIASERAAMYDLLLDVFVGLPDDALLSEIEDGRFDALLATNGASVAPSPGKARGVSPSMNRLTAPTTKPDGERIREGARLVASCRSSSRNGRPGALVKELLVDRTRVLRATGEKGFSPPYERLYSDNPTGDGLLLQALSRFYRKAGMSLEDESCESPDFLFVELDFMKQLCLREIEEYFRGIPAGPTRAIEREFLRRHLGRWAGAYCAEAEKRTRTVFYRGFLAVLDGFITAEISYLDE